jgi:Asp-tRNA(Asn)/Glu-tRNA(Gln) amidotransferase A subunit family amidase
LPVTLVGLQQALADGELSPQEAIAAQRKSLNRLNRHFHAVVEELTEPAQAASRQKLSGIGLAHKDIFDLQGRSPGLGLGTGVAEPGLKAATAIQRLSKHGASHLATLVMAEYACGASSENAHFSRCVNPLHPDAVVGGSSSGSAVAVSSHMAYASLGTDTAGSVRIPAATCGLIGVKTTPGVVSTEGVYPLAPSLDSVGVLGRTAEDTRQVLEAVAEGGSLMPASADSAKVKAWIPETALHESVALAMQECVRSMHIVTQTGTCKQHTALTQLSEIVLHTEAACTHRQALLEGRSPAAVESVALAGLVIPRPWYEAAIACRAQHVRDFVRTHLEGHDILMVPALSTPIPDWNEVMPGNALFNVRQLLGLHRFMGFVNYLGLPALVVPVATDKRGLPISVQLIGRPFHELGLLKYARQIESQHFNAGLAMPLFR